MLSKKNSRSCTVVSSLETRRIEAARKPQHRGAGSVLNCCSTTREEDSEPQESKPWSEGWGNTQHGVSLFICPRRTVIVGGKGHLLGGDCTQGICQEDGGLWTTLLFPEAYDSVRFWTEGFFFESSDFVSQNLKVPFSVRLYTVTGGQVGTPNNQQTRFITTCPKTKVAGPNHLQELQWSLQGSELL